MGKLQREGIWNTIISYAGIAIGYVNLIMLFPNFLEEEEVGLTRLMITVSEMLAQFAALGFVNMSGRYFPFFRDKEKKHNGFLFLLLVVPMFGFAAITVLFLLFKPIIIDYYQENSQLFLQYYYYLIPLGLFALLFQLFTAYLRSLFKTIVSSFVKDFLLRLLIMGLLFVYYFEWINFQQFVILFVIINSLTALFLVIYTVWLKQFYIKPSLSAIQVIPLREILSYGLFTFMGSMSVTIIKTTDQIMVSAISLVDNAIYTTAFYITSAIATPALAIMKIAVPQVAEYWKDKDLENLGKFYKQITLTNLIIGMLLFIGIWANIDNIYSLMPETYRAGAYVVLLLSMARIVDMATGINGIILATSAKYRWDLLFNVVLAGLTIWTNYIFIPLYGINGAALASMITLITINLARLFFVKWLYKIQPFTFKSLLIVFIAAGTLLLSYILPYMGNVFLDIVVRSSLITIVYSSLTITLNIYPDMNTWLFKTWKSLTKSA